MWKRIALVLALWAWVPACRQPLRGQTPGVGKDEAIKPKQVPNSKTDTTQNDQRGTQEIPLVVDTQGHRQTKDEADQAKAARDHNNFVERRTLFFAGVAACATVALVFIGLGGVVAAIWTLRAIRDQVDALISSERAWVLLKTVGGPEKWYAPGFPGVFPSVILDFEVHGKTPVKIIRLPFQLRPVPAKPGVMPPEPDLPLVPDYGNSVLNAVPLPKDGLVLAPGQLFRVTANLVGLTLKEEEWIALRDSKTIMCSYGFIDYEDAFGRKKETRVCQVYSFAWGGVITAPDGTILNPKGFQLGGPPEYNKTT